VGGDEPAVMRVIDEIYTKHPFYGVRRVTNALKRLGWCINHKRVARLMQVMGLEAIYPKPRLSVARKEHRKYPYLLRNLSIMRPDQVWSTDITYIRLKGGHVYLAAILDWFSRYVVSWTLSITIDANFCVDMLKGALTTARPEIFNSDQGVQFTSDAFTGILKDHCIRISMDGRGRAFDNIFVERLWRTVKYEEVYLRDYSSVSEARCSVRQYFEFYNNERPHQSLGYKTPSEVYYARGNDINRNCFESGKPLIQSPVQNINDLLLHEYREGAPLERIQGELHLKQMKILS